MKKLVATLAVISSLSPLSHAWADGAMISPNTSRSVPADTRIKLLSYDDSDVYTIRTKYGYQTNIVFGGDEEIQTLSMGDRTLWQIIPSGNRLFIRPLGEDLTTNMTLITNKRTYEFDLKSVPAGAENNIYVARFIYPSKNATPPAPINYDTFSPAPSKAVNPPPASPHPLQPNYNYTYAGPDALAPLQVSDNGKVTSVKYRSLPVPLPTVFVVGPDGREIPATFTLQKNTLEIDGVAGELRLKSQAGNVQLFNELLNPR
jgi:type IV secretion system protein VirB9